MNRHLKSRLTRLIAIRALVFVILPAASIGRTTAQQLALAPQTKAANAAPVVIKNSSVFSIPAGQPTLPQNLGAVAGPAVAVKPAVPLIAPAVLFARYVTDARIRALASARFNAHHTLTRADMLDILRDAEKEGRVSGSELTSLRALAMYGASIKMPGYVQDLATKLLFGDPANAHFQGRPLGNLAVGSSGTQLELLVKKWFLGADRPAIDASFHYELAKGQLFSGAPRVGDVNQGAGNDCTLLATLGDSARLNPQFIQSMFIDNRDGTFTVRFYHGGRPTYVSVDRYLPANGDHAFGYDGSDFQASDPDAVLWPALAEKAYAELNASGWLDLDKRGVNSYAALAAMDGEVIPTITGVSFTSGWDGGSLVSRVDAGALTIAGSNDKVADGLVGDHAYAVVGYNPQTKEVTLFNPWGGGGWSTLSWAKFVANFNYIDYSNRPIAHADGTFTPDDEGFVRDWLVMAGLPNGQNVTGPAALDKQFLGNEANLKPKAGDQALVGNRRFSWKVYEAGDYSIDFNSFLGQETDSSTAYAVAYIVADADMTGLNVLTGSDDEAKLYINGKQVMKHAERRGIEKDQDTTRNITLHKGVNVVVFKVVNEQGGWAGALRFTDKSNKPVRIIQVRLTP